MGRLGEGPPAARKLRTVTAHGGVVASWTAAAGTLPKRRAEQNIERVTCTARSGELRQPARGQIARQPVFTGVKELLCPYVSFVHNHSFGQE
jgi:hypothetical protein